MNTKFIKIATCALAILCVGSLTVQAGGPGGGAGVTLKSITTKSGVRYVDIEVISADAFGLLFRHSQGTAKVDFINMNQNLRDMFETVPAEVVVPEGGKRDDNAAEAIDDDEYAYESLDILSRSRIVINLPRGYGCYHTCCNPFDPATVNWQPYWGPYHYGLSCANFNCRQAAERDFLIQSGIARHRFGR